MYKRSGLEKKVDQLKEKVIIVRSKVFFSIFFIVLFVVLLFLLDEYILKTGVTLFIFDELKYILFKIIFILNYPILVFGNASISLISILIFTLIVIFGFLLGKFYKKFVFNIKSKYPDISSGNITILANMGYYIILTVVFLSSLKIIGLDLSSLTLIVGALSVGIGFGLQGIVSNFFSGMILMFEKSIKIGDFIELTDELRGKVTDLNMRSTTIRTNDNIDIVIPNNSFIDNNITNWTLNDYKVRIKVPFGVAYGTPVKLVDKVILTALKESNLEHFKTGDKAPQIIMTGMGSSSVDFELLVWIRGAETMTPIIRKSGFLKLIYTTLNENNISIPFPQTDLHIVDSVPLEISLKK